MLSVESRSAGAARSGALNGNGRRPMRRPAAGGDGFLNSGQIARAARRTGACGGSREKQCLI
ncbi:hypothetical protein K6W76_01905, partial [Burkholderia anthina]|uniref:hypothetical protein n=1 Tax=Burkholderia anthina TaxID=179879 RepID=UPI001C98AC6E